MLHDITEWLNKHHKEWYYLYNEEGEFLRHSFKPPEDATHYRHIQDQFRQVGTYYRVQPPRDKLGSQFLSYMISGYSDWRTAHLSTMKADIEEIEANCFHIIRVEGPFEK